MEKRGGVREFFSYDPRGVSKEKKSRQQRRKPLYFFSFKYSTERKVNRFYLNHSREVRFKKVCHQLHAF